MASIREMVAALECDYDRLEELRDADERTDEENEELAELQGAAGECEDREQAEQRIHEDPLSLLYRSGWVESKDDMEPEEFELLLTTGGPAVRILGEIRDGEPRRAWLEVQDWGKPWTRYYEAGCDELLMAYCRCFCMETN